MDTWRDCTHRRRPATFAPPAPLTSAVERPVAIADGGASLDSQCAVRDATRLFLATALFSRSLVRTFRAIDHANHRSYLGRDRESACPPSSMGPPLARAGTDRVCGDAASLHVVRCAALVALRSARHVRSVWPGRLERSSEHARS